MVGFASGKSRIKRAFTPVFFVLERKKNYKIHASGQQVAALTHGLFGAGKLQLFLSILICGHINFNCPAFLQ